MLPINLTCFKTLFSLYIYIKEGGEGKWGEGTWEICCAYIFLLLYHRIVILLSLRRFSFFPSVWLIFLVLTLVIIHFFFLCFLFLITHLTYIQNPVATLFFLIYLFSIHQLFWILALATALSCKKIKHSILKHLLLPRTCLHIYWSNNPVGPVTPRNNFHLFSSYLAEDKSSQNLYAISSELFKSIVMISLLGLTFTVMIVNFSFFLFL